MLDQTSHASAPHHPPSCQNILFQNSTWFPKKTSSTPTYRLCDSFNTHLQAMWFTQHPPTGYVIYSTPTYRLCDSFNTHLQAMWFTQHPPTSYVIHSTPTYTLCDSLNTHLQAMWSTQHPPTGYVIHSTSTYKLCDPQWKTSTTTQGLLPGLTNLNTHGLFRWSLTHRSVLLK